MLDELRRRTEGLADWLDRHTYGTVRPSRLYLGKTYSGGSFPTAAGRVYLTHPMAVAATESEGSTPTFTVDASSSVPVLVLDGPLAANDFVVARLIGGLWVAEKGQGTGGGGGGATGSFSGCSCATAPTPLYLHVSTEGGDYGAFNSATLSYGAFPCVSASFPSGFQAYVSTTSFIDSLTGDAFYYYISCTGSTYYLGAIYPTSIFGSCYYYLMYSWIIGGSNTCTPFSLTSGSNLISGTTTASITETP